jgi:hypothetical protein
MGFSGPALHLLKSFLSDRMQQVRINDTLSSLKNIHSGVPQGSILSPILFSIFIDDLLSSTQYLQSHAYADDTIFHASDPSITTLIHSSQSDINKILSWCDSNGMMVNTEKSHYLISNAESQPVQLHLGHTPLSRLNKTNFLGFVINDRLDWSDHTAQLLTRMAINTRLLLATRHVMNTCTALRFYNHFIHSRLSYGVDIYYALAPLKLTKPLLTLQKKALKYALLVPRRTHTHQVTAATHVLLLPELAAFSSCILAFKAQHGLCPSYLSKIFQPPNTSKTILTRNTYKIHSSSARNTLESFTANSFNSLPKALRNKKTLPAFKTHAKQHFLTSYDTTAT